MAPTKAKLKVIQTQISETIEYIQELKAQVERNECKLQQLRDEEAAILETSKNHRRVLSTVRTLPEDILREICIDCVETSQPVLSYRRMPLPYVLAQVSRGMRRIVLETPIIWASMCVQIDSSCFGRFGDQVCTMLARSIRQWFDRAGDKALAVSIHEIDASRQKRDASYILLDALFSYSARWKELRFESSCDVVATPIMRVAALTAVDVPMLQSISIHIDRWATTPQHFMLSQTALLKLPTLKHLLLDTDIVTKLYVNWAILTSITLRAHQADRCYPQTEVVNMLRKTRHLMSFNVHVVGDRLTLHGLNRKVTLPFLKNLSITERSFGSIKCTLYAEISAPALEVFHLDAADFIDHSLSNFFWESPHIWKLSLPYFSVGNDPALTVTARLLRYCPSLTALSLQSRGWDQNAASWNADTFFRAFVNEGEFGITCPRLQYIKFTGEIDFSPQTLQLFLEGKQQGIAAPNITPWKRVIIDIGSIKSKEKIKQILDIVSRKRKEGLNVDAFSKEEQQSKDRHFFE